MSRPRNNGLYVNYQFYWDMKVDVLKTESAVLGGTVLHFSEWETVTDILDAEKQLIRQHHPLYIFCRVSSTDLRSIQNLEKAGFGFSEFRISSQLQVGNEILSQDAFYPYKLELIGNEDDLRKAQQLLLKNQPDDRFYNDPLLKQNLSRERELLNLEKSFRSYPNEFILGLFNVQTMKLVAFRSGAIENKNIANYYLYAIESGVDKNHFAEILDYLCISYLKEQGVTLLNAVSTGFNIDELNRLSQNYNFSIKTTEVLMRKVYKK